MNHRKLWVGSTAATLIVVAFILATFRASAQPTFGKFVAGRVALAGLYFGANVGAKFSNKPPAE